MAYTIPKETDLEAWAERNLLCGEYLPLIAKSSGFERQKLICDLSCKLFDSWALRRIALVTTLDDIPLFDIEQQTYLSQIVMPHLSAVGLDELELAAVDLAVAGRRSHFLGNAIRRSVSSVSARTFTDAHPIVFISYSHDTDPMDHCDSVHALANRLRSDGVDVNIDRYSPFPKEGWPQWMLNQVRNSDFVLCVCTAVYCERFENQKPREEGKGVRFEGHVITN